MKSLSKAEGKYTKMCPFCIERGKGNIHTGLGKINLHPILVRVLFKYPNDRFCEASSISP